jgi:hypothetical protein
MTYLDEVKLAHWRMKAELLANLARQDGVIVEILLMPTTPLRMGGYESVADTRIVRQTPPI